MVEATPPPPPRSLRVVHSSTAMTPTGMNSFGSAAWLLIGGLGESFHPCCFNDNHGGAGAKCWGRWWGGGVLLLFTLCNAACQPPPSSSCKSVPVPFQLLGSTRAFHFLFLSVSGPISRVPPPLLSFPLHSSLFSGCSICLNSAVSFLRT